MLTCRENGLNCMGNLLRNTKTPQVTPNPSAWDSGIVTKCLALSLSALSCSLHATAGFREVLCAHQSLNSKGVQRVFFLNLK